MESKKNIELVIFDFDGTLVNMHQNSEGLRKKLKKYFTEKYGTTLSFKPMLQQLDNIREKLGEEAYREGIRIMDDDDLECVSKSEILKGTREFLKLLKNMGIRIAIFSRNSKKSVELMCKKFGINADMIVGREDVKRPKPEPDGLLKIINTLKVNKENTVYIGDHIYDALAAEKANITFLAIITGSTPAETFYKKNIKVFKKMRELIAYFKKVVY